MEAVVYRRSISEVPGKGGVVFNGIGREIFEDKEVVVQALRAIVDGESGFWREVDYSCFGKGVDTSKGGGCF